MAVNATLGARLREQDGKAAAKKLRQQGRIPAILYGHNEQTRPISVDAQELSNLLARISVENTVITLKVEDGGAPVKALVREVQSHPFRKEILHLDFYQIHAGELVVVDVPVRLAGTAPGVKAGGILDQILYSLHVRCMADRIPETIDCDVSGLNVNESLHVRELTLPEGVEVLNDGELTVVTCVPPAVHAATEAQEVAPPAGSEPEVIRKRAGEEE